MTLILGMLLLFYFGFLLTLMIHPRLDLFTRLGISFPLGIGLESFLMFIAALSGFPLSETISLTLLFIPALFLTFYCFNQLRSLIGEHRGFSFSFYNIRKIELLLLLLIIVPLLINLIYNLYWPIDGWDTLVLYDFRAKYFVLSHSIYPTPDLDYFVNYPLMTSLAHTFVYQLGGNNPRFLYSLFYISLLLVFYGQIQLNRTKTIALLSILLVITYPLLDEHARIPYTNLPYSVYIVTGTIFLYRWLKSRLYSELLISALMIGISGWTRFVEPFWAVCILIVLVASLLKRNIVAPILYGATIMSFREPWIRYLNNIVGHYSNTFAGQVSTSVQAVSHFPSSQLLSNIAVYLYTGMIETWQPFVLIFVILIIFECIERKINAKLLIIVVLHILALWTGTYVFALSYGGWQDIKDSATRLSMFFVPLFIFYIFESRLLFPQLSQKNHIKRKAPS